MFLKSIRLKNIKCFSDVELEFLSEAGDIRKWTLLLGENGTGKSTLLKAIALATCGSDALLDLLKEPGDLIRLGQPYCEISAVVLTAEQEEKNITLRISPSDSRADVIVRNKESLAWLDQLSKTSRNYFVVGFGVSRRLAQNEGRRAKTARFQSKRAQSVATLFDPDAVLHPLESWAMDLDYVDEKRGLSTISAVLNDLLPGVKFHRIDKQSGQLLFETPDGIVPLELLSEGYQTMAAFIGDLLFRVWETKEKNPLETRGLLLIDEIDLHLHPKWQRELLSFLEVKLPFFQFIATTHSPMTAQQVGKGQLYYLLRERGKIELNPFVGTPKRLLLNQFLMTDAFGLSTDESKEIEEKKKRYRQLRDKASLSPKERAELDELTADLKDLPTSSRSNLLLSFEQQNLLRKIEKELGEGGA